MAVHLEELVAERTAELSATNQALKTEIDERIRAQEALKRYQEQLKALTSELTVAEERERRRIAEELHDGPLQALAFARIQLDTARKAGGDGERARSLGEVSEKLQAATPARWRQITWIPAAANPPCLPATAEARAAGDRRPSPRPERRSGFVFRRDPRRDDRAPTARRHSH